MHVTGLALLFLGAGTVVSGAVGVGYDDPDAAVLLTTGTMGVAIGASLWRLTRVPARLLRAEAFFTVSATWVLICAAATVPYLIAGTFDSVVNAWFEAVSGLSTTGSTVLADIEGQGKGMLFYRQYTQFFGGGGIVLLAVAVLEGLGVGGLALAGAEIAGPTSEGIAPRVITVARRLWRIYVGMVLAVAAALLIVGVGPYDAVTHAMATIPTAGFSTFNDSIGHFDSAAVEVVLIAGMFLGGTNFSLHYRVLQGGPRRYWQSPEFRTFATVFAAGIAVVSVINIGDGMAVSTAIRDSAFNVATTLTTCGFGTADFTRWVPSAQLLLVGFMLMGGMTGSTSGGIKMLRVRVVAQHALREVKRARHPRGVFVIRHGRRAIPETIVSEILAFATIYILVVLASILLMIALGSDPVTATGGVVSAIGLVGPGLAESGPASNFLVYSEPARGVLTFLMLLGRMEIFVLLLALSGPYQSARRRLASNRRRGTA